jgi:hypothetical protein
MKSISIGLRGLLRARNSMRSVRRRNREEEAGGTEDGCLALKGTILVGNACEWYLPLRGVCTTLIAHRIRSDFQSWSNSRGSEGSRLRTQNPSCKPIAGLSCRLHSCPDSAVLRRRGRMPITRVEGRKEGVVVITMYDMYTFRVVRFLPLVPGLQQLGVIGSQYRSLQYR